MLFRESFHVQFVNDRFMPWRPRTFIRRSLHPLGDDPSERRAGCRIPLWIADGVVPDQIARDRPGVRVEQNFARIEAMPPRRLVRPVNSIAIDLARPRIRQVSMPDLMCLLGQRDPMRFALRSARLEQTQLNPGRVLGEDREIDATLPAGRTEGRRITRPDAHTR